MKRSVTYNSSYIPKVQLLPDLYGRRCIYVEFEGHVTEEIINNVVEHSVKLAKEDSDEKITVVWNCIDLKSYDTEAREACERGITNNSHLMDRIYVVSTSLTVLAAAEIIKYFTPLPLTAVSSFEKLEQKFNNL